MKMDLQSPLFYLVLFRKPFHDEYITHQAFHELNNFQKNTSRRFVPEVYGQPPVG